MSRAKWKRARHLSFPKFENPVSRCFPFLPRGNKKRPLVSYLVSSRFPFPTYRQETGNER